MGAEVVHVTVEAGINIAVVVDAAGFVVTGLLNETVRSASSLSAVVGLVVLPAKNVE